MKPRVIHLIVILAGLSACNSWSPITRSQEPKTHPAEIAFATCTAAKTSDGFCKIELVEFQILEGTVKNKPQSALLFPVEVVVTDPAGRELTTFRIEHPLLEDLEIADDRGNLRRLTRTMDSARIYLRFRHLPGMDAVRFEADHPSMPKIKTIIKLKP